MLQHDLLNDPTAQFKVPTTVIAVDAASIDDHVEAINTLVAELKRTTAKFKEDTAEIEEAIGQHIKAIKIAEADNWESVVKAKCGLSRSRAYELMAIADGTKTVKQTRRETNVRQIRFRQNKPSVSVTDKATTDTQVTELKVAHKQELADARAEFAEREEGHKRQIARFENKIAELSDARNIDSERDRLRKALDEINDLLAEMGGLMTHPIRNQGTVTTKIVRARTIANLALKSAKVAIVNLPAEQAATPTHH